MTHETLKSVLEMYCDKLQTMGYLANENIKRDIPCLSDKLQILSYIHWMCLECQKILKKALIIQSHGWQEPPIIDCNEIEKAMRWLGFIQGVLWTHGISVHR